MGQRLGRHTALMRKVEGAGVTIAQVDPTAIQAKLLKPLQDGIEHLGQFLLAAGRHGDAVHDFEALIGLGQIALAVDQAVDHGVHRSRHLPDVVVVVDPGARIQTPGADVATWRSFRATASSRKVNRKAENDAPARGQEGHQ